MRIELLTLLNVRDCRSCVHDLSALRLLLENPLELQCSVEVRVDNLLHAKLYIFDDSEAIVTSSNLTYAGFNRNLEVALATSLPTPVQATISHFQSLFRNAIPLTQAALEEVASLLRTLPSASIDLLQPEGPGGRAEELDEFPFDPNAIEQIDTALEKQLAKEVQDSFLSIETVGVDAVDAEGLLETRFYEEMQSNTNIAGRRLRSRESVSMMNLIREHQGVGRAALCTTC